MVTNDPEKCVGCNRCIRVCPMEEANIAENVGKSIVVHIDRNKCISCGACVRACPHGVRTYEDDTERFFTDLQNGIRIALIAAPAMKTNIENWPRVLTWFKELGITKVYDVSLGADICTWAHIRYLQQNARRKLITQPCPVIVNYIIKHQPDLMDHLSPVHSPMLCTAVYMRRHEQVETRIAALSPCIAKSSEFEDTGNVIEYNITFDGLQKYMDLHGTSLPQGRSGFDHFDAGLGFLFPMPGGLKENLEHYLGKTVRIDRAEGPHVYHALEAYAHEPEQNLPTIFDVLNCEEGCNNGTGCTMRAKSPFEMRTLLNNTLQNTITDEGRERLDKLYAYFDKNLQVSNYLRKYASEYVPRIAYSLDGVEQAFESLGKLDEQERNFNCSACGSDTCKEMAVKIAKRINTPLNCINKAHRDVSVEHAELLLAQKATMKSLDTIMTDITKIKETTEEIVTDVAKVKLSIEDFDRMASDIRKIAFQINIISLNASIEAAKAGKAGRAFTVVAEEIGNLANSSRRSVQNSAQLSDRATHTIEIINDRVLEINRSVQDSYVEIGHIYDKTRELIDKTSI